MERETIWLLEQKEEEVERLWQLVREMKERFQQGMSELPTSPNTIFDQVVSADRKDASTQTPPQKVKKRKGDVVMILKK